MAWQINWTQTALGDIKNVASFIAKDSTYYAAAFVREVRNAARSLNTLARRGRIVPEFQDPQVRELFVRDYRLIYKIANDGIYILAFIHGARNLPSIMNQKNH